MNKEHTCTVESFDGTTPPPCQACLEHIDEPKTEVERLRAELEAIKRVDSETIVNMNERIEELKSTLARALLYISDMGMCAEIRALLDDEKRKGRRSP